MKTILKINIFFLLLFSIAGAGCQKDKIESADENIKVSSIPGLSVYKTKGDYYNFISVQLSPAGQLSAIPGYTLDDPRINVDSRGHITPNSRWRLKSGYIVDTEASPNTVFTNITFQVYVDYNTANDVAGWPNQLIDSRIIDKYPFLEYYHYSGLNKPVRYFTLGEINNMIEHGNIDSTFTRLK